MAQKTPKKRVKFVVYSDDEPEFLGSTKAPTANASTFTRAPHTGQYAVRGDAEMDEDQPEVEAPKPVPAARPIAEAKPKPKPKGKGSRMLKELGAYNESATSSSDSESSESPKPPEALMEGLHRTRAARRNVTNAMNNKALAVRKSLNAQVLMEEALRPKAPELPHKRKKKTVRHIGTPIGIDDTFSESDEGVQAKPASRRGRKTPKIEDSDQEIGGALSGLEVKVKKPKIVKVKKKKQPPQISEDSGEQDEDFIPAKTPAYLQPPAVIKAKRRSLRNASVVAAPTVNAPSPPKVTASGMTWEEKKDVIAWLLGNVDYGPYRPQATRHSLTELRSFNEEYAGFNWDEDSLKTIARFSPSGAMLQDFTRFLHVVEFFFGQQLGAVKIAVPRDFVQPPDNFAGITRNYTVRAYEMIVLRIAGSASDNGEIYKITSLGSHDVATGILLDDVVRNESARWKGGRLQDARTEQQVLASNWYLFGENLCATDALRNKLGCGDPCLSDCAGNRLHQSSSSKTGINKSAFDLCRNASGMQMTELGLYRLVYHHKGAPRVWTVVRPSDFRKLEDLVAETLYLPNTENPADDSLSSYKIRCQQFVGHKELSKINGPAGFSIEEDPGETLYFPTKILEEKGIGFTRFLQHSGELVILFPFSYYQCYNVGSNIVESMAYASDRWEVFPAANLVRQCGRSCFNGKQPPLVDLEFAKSISRNTPGLRPSIQEAIEQTRAHFLASGR